MKKAHIICAIAIVTMSGMIIRCNKENGPTNPQTEALGNVIFQEGFESASSFDSIYKQINYDFGQKRMSITTQSKHSGNASLTSYDTSTSIKRRIEPSITDSIAGLQFYMMATKKSHANTFVGIYRYVDMTPPSLMSYTMEMGIDKSDSLKYVFEYCPVWDACPFNEYKNFAALELNKWYECKIEYNYTDTTLTYSVDNRIVHKITVPNPMELNMFFVMRDNLGAPGTSGYYIDDITVYKR